MPTAAPTWAAVFSSAEATASREPSTAAVPAAVEATDAQPRLTPIATNIGRNQTGAACPRGTTSTPSTAAAPPAGPPPLPPPGAIARGTRGPRRHPENTARVDGAEQGP